MIVYRQIGRADWPKFRSAALQLVRTQADRHITRRAYENMRSMHPKALDEAGNVIFSAWEGSLLVGILLCERFGNRSALAVVRRTHRSQGIAKELLRRALAAMGRFYAEVATDNIASLRVVFGMGMIADGVFRRHGKWVLKVRNPTT